MLVLYAIRLGALVLLLPMVVTPRLTTKLFSIGIRLLDHILAPLRLLVVMMMLMRFLSAVAAAVAAAEVLFRIRIGQV